MLSPSKSVLNPDSDVTNLTYIFDLTYVSRDLDIQSMAVDMTDRHHVRENGRSFNSLFEMIATLIDAFCFIFIYYIRL